MTEITTITEARNITAREGAASAIDALSADLYDALSTACDRLHGIGLTGLRDALIRGTGEFSDADFLAVLNAA